MENKNRRKKCLKIRQQFKTAMTPHTLQEGKSSRVRVNTQSTVIRGNNMSPNIVIDLKVNKTSCIEPVNVCDNSKEGF